MNDRHPNAPGHDFVTGEVDEDVMVEVLDPISIGALATLQRVEIDQQVATAKAYPRNVPKIKQELTALVTMDEDTADDCIYALPRGQKHIKGPSARFADALISFWGNARSGAFITQVNKEEKFVEAIGSFQDVERNVIRQRRVRRPIAGRDGRVYNADMINMTGNAACVIAERNAILNGIPKSLWSGAYEQAFALVAGTTKTLGEKLERATKAFALQGITMEQVLEKLERQDISKIVPDDIVTMRGMLTALKTGEETVETIFGRGAGSSHEKVQNPLKDDPAKVSDTIADSRRDNVKRAAVESGTRGNAREVAEVNTVIDGKGLIIKSRNGEIEAPILDRRFTADDQTFATFAEWSDATESMPDPEFPKKADPISSGLPNKTETASTEGGNVKQDAEGAGKPAGEVSKAAAPDTASGGKNAQAAAPTKPYSDAEGYMTHMRDEFDRAKEKGSKSAVTEIWGSTRTDRAELLSPEQLDELSRDKAATLTAIKLKEGKS